MDSKVEFTGLERNSHSEYVWILCVRDGIISAGAEGRMGDRTDQRGYIAAVHLGVVA
jgi:hypothetical protein